MSMAEFGDNLDADEEYDVLQSILDFPMECLEEDEDVEDWDVSNLECLGPIPSSVLMGPPLMPNESFNIRPPNVFPRPVSLIAGVPELEQQPKHVDISGMTIPPQRKLAKVQCGSFHTQSPVSVLESKSLCAKSDNTIPVRSRSKRVRYVGVNPWLKQTLDGKRIAKRCAHCQSTDTPQWRLGPLGPNTLCNACGVRYRSGRLFPEYRPAASPMFVQSQHSNIHRKVVEMRGKVKQPSSPNIKAVVEEPPLGLKMKAKALELPISQLEFVHITRAPKDVLPPHKAGAPKQIWLANHIESSNSSLRKKNVAITSTKMKCKKPSLPNKTEERTKKSFHSLEASNPSHSSKPWHGLIKKCAHCQSTKTPQWREGPLGPRTLCNACGVRYKSGRLHPEYRPAASPTFMASKHSNLHKEVIQMIEAEVTTEVPTNIPTYKLCSVIR